ncbi:hypothetical protein E2C01_085277 [Portunus trituberculatus]|uniref:Uncharacterized protein n=1 Tax=Portunus trituberculatus TaxID=210409 RepID=A0A5B7IXF0_PORTR|nr:hypothetical protein [Portunus trituberculatus]
MSEPDPDPLWPSSSLSESMSGLAFLLFMAAVLSLLSRALSHSSGAGRGGSSREGRYGRQGRAGTHRALSHRRLSASLHCVSVSEQQQTSTTRPKEGAMVPSLVILTTFILFLFFK